MNVFDYRPTSEDTGKDCFHGDEPGCYCGERLPGNGFFTELICGMKVVFFGKNPPDKLVQSKFAETFFDEIKEDRTGKAGEVCEHGVPFFSFRPEAPGPSPFKREVRFKIVRWDYAVMCADAHLLRKAVAIAARLNVDVSDAMITCKFPENELGMDRNKAILLVPPR